MLKVINPQKVLNDTLGYTVQIVDRYHVEYLEAERRALVEVDFGPVIGVYGSTLTTWVAPYGDRQMSEGERNSVLSRIVEALKFMGSEVELC